MAVTKANLPPLLRAATALHHNSPTSFLRSHPSNILISNPHLFSTFLHRRVRPRATAFPNPLSLSISNHHLVSRSVHTHATALHKRRTTFHILDYALAFGCIAAAGGIILLYKNREKPRMFATITDDLEFRFHGIMPHMYRKGHYLVVEGLARPFKRNNISNATAKYVGDEGPLELYMSATAKYVGDEGPLELYMSATEVLPRRDHVVTALHKNYTILAVKQIYSKDNDKILATTNRLASSSGQIGISTHVDDLSKWSKYKSKKIDSLVTKFVLLVLDEFEEYLPKILGEGHSIFIEGIIDIPLNSIKFDEINKIWPGKWNEDDWPKKLKGKPKRMGVMLAKAIAKHDERYMPREAAASAIERNNAK
ncbi:hypothetical protein ACET3Z_014697 [Daucus carota]